MPDTLFFAFSKQNECRATCNCKAWVAWGRAVRPFRNEKMLVGVTHIAGVVLLLSTFTMRCLLISRPRRGLEGRSQGITTFVQSAGCSILLETRSMFLLRVGTQFGPPRRKAAFGGQGTHVIGHVGLDKAHNFFVTTKLCSFRWLHDVSRDQTPRLKQPAHWKFECLRWTPPRVPQVGYAEAWKDKYLVTCAE